MQRTLKNRLKTEDSYLPKLVKQHDVTELCLASSTRPRRRNLLAALAQYIVSHFRSSSTKSSSWFLSSLFSGRRQLQPDVTSSFVGYCACSCSPPCRRGPVGDVKLVCLALWRKREYLTFISIRFVAFSNQHFADYRS